MSAYGLARESVPFPVAVEHLGLVPLSAPERRITVLIPAKNEEGNIAWVLRHMPPSVDEVILVDGMSRDRTVEIAQAVRPDIVVIVEPPRGKGAAMRAGFAAATGDYVVVMDADGSMDPADVDAYVAALEAGADLVKGSRYMNGGGSTDLTVVRSLGNRFLLVVANVLYRQRFSELCYGFLALRTSRIPDLRLQATGFEIEAEIVCRSVREGLRVAEIPSQESPRISGASNLHAVRDGLRILKTVLRAALPLPTRKPAVLPVPTMHLLPAMDELQAVMPEPHLLAVPVAADTAG
jgi:glycosyltransferase involved in cell wall biosynthesis